MYTILKRILSGLNNKGYKEFYKQIGTKIVNAYIYFIALLSYTTNRSLGDTGVILEDIKT